MDPKTDGFQLRNPYLDFMDLPEVFFFNLKKDLENCSCEQWSAIRQLFQIGVTAAHKNAFANPLI